MLPVLLAALAAPVALAAPSAMLAFFDPTANGGSWLNNANDGYGEPLNVSAHPCIVSGLNVDPDFYA